MPADDVVAPGGAVIESNTATGDISNYITRLLQGHTGSYPLLNYMIPTFDDYAAMVAAYPSPTVLNTPPLARTYDTGDDFGALYRYNPSAGAWTPLGGFGGILNGTVSYAGATIITNPDATGIASLSVASATNNRAIDLSFAALVNFGLAGDVVDVVLRRDGTDCRASRKSAVPVLTSTGSGGTVTSYGTAPLPQSGEGNFSDIIAPGDSPTFQVIIRKVAGGGGCTSTNNSSLSYLQAKLTNL